MKYLITSLIIGPVCFVTGIIVEKKYNDDDLSNRETMVKHQIAKKLCNPQLDENGRQILFEYKANTVYLIDKNGVLSFDVK